MNLPLGWLSPSGEFIECDYYNHISIAHELVEKYGYHKVGSKPDDDILLYNGWVHIGITSIGKKEWAIYWENFLTEEQKNAIKPYFEDDEIPMCFVSQCKWEKENDF